MSIIAAPRELEPMSSASLRRRFPGLAEALDAEVMRGHLQRLVLDGTGVVALSCARPRAEVDGDLCWLQYPLRIDGAPDGSRDLLVLGAMFAGPDRAGRYERTALAAPSARWAARRTGGPRPSGVLPSLSLAVSVFPVNGPLPTLVDATDEPGMRAVLHDRLGAAADPGALPGIELVSFRRSGGCVLRYRVAGGGGHATVYGKVGYPDAGGIVGEIVAELARTSSRPDRPILYPQVLGQVAELDLVLTAGVRGKRPDLRDDGERGAAVEAAALVAAAIHTSGIRAGERHTLDDELDRAWRAVRAIDRDAPELAAWLGAVLDLLSRAALRRPAGPPVLAHGDLTPSQLLLDGSRVGIVDFDGLCQADPAFDLGRFLAYLRLALTKAGIPGADAAASRLSAAYEAAGAQPVPESRVELYAIIALVQTAAHCWRELKPARLRLACSVLEERLGRL